MGPPVKRNGFVVASISALIRYSVTEKVKVVELTGEDGEDQKKERKAAAARNKDGLSTGPPFYFSLFILVNIGSRIPFAMNRPPMGRTKFS